MTLPWSELGEGEPKTRVPGIGGDSAEGDLESAIDPGRLSEPPGDKLREGRVRPAIVAALRGVLGDLGKEMTEKRS